jgi:hypothetical protein
MCQGNNFDTTMGLVHNVPRLHVGDCKGFNGPHFAMPKVDDRLKVTGLYVQDIYERGHTEIHPVYKIESIDGSLAHPSSPPNDSITTVTTPSLLTHK